MLRAETEALLLVGLNGRRDLRPHDLHQTGRRAHRETQLCFEIAHQFERFTVVLLGTETCDAQIRAFFAVSMVHNEREIHTMLLL